MKLSKRERKIYCGYIYYKDDLEYFEKNTRKIKIYDSNGYRITHKNFIKLETKDVFIRLAFRILNYKHRQEVLGHKEKLKACRESKNGKFYLEV